METKLTLPQFERIYIEDFAVSSKLAQRFLALYKEKCQIVESSPLDERPGPLSAQEFDRSKRLLMIKPFRGQFFKRCPGVSQKKPLACCNYYVLNLGQQCNFNCSYCYLQSYLNSPMMMVYSNIGDALDEIYGLASTHPELPYRVGTGEVVDSLSLDPITLYSRQLIEFFRQFPKWTLELKTKSDCVDQFLDCEHAGNVSVGWSVNPQLVIDNEEFGTASLAQRLNAARKCHDFGYQIAFHLDPLIYFPNWQEHYSDLVGQITEAFSPDRISNLSIGSLRFQPHQRHLMRERFGMKSWVVRGEMFPSEGGKLRYDFNLRQQMYDFILSRFREKSSEYKILLCMETPESWIQQYDNSPMHTENLRELFRPLPKLETQSRP